MTGGWLEHEIRSNPHVLSCSITEEDIVVLVQPSADPVAVERSISHLLRTRGVDLPVRVFGGARPVFVQPVKIRNGRPALVGTFGGALALAAGVWLAGSGAGLRGGSTGGRSRDAAELVLAPPVVRDVVTVPSNGGADPVAPEDPPPAEPAPSKPILRPSGRKPILGPIRPPAGRAGAHPPVAAPPAAAEPPPVAPPAVDPPLPEPPPSPAPPTVDDPDDDDDEDDDRGRGRGRGEPRDDHDDDEDDEDDEDDDDEDDEDDDEPNDDDDDDD